MERQTLADANRLAAKLWPAKTTSFWWLILWELLCCWHASQKTGLEKKIAGIFLLATPFWKGDEDWVEAFKLKPDFAKQLDKNTPLFFYHCRDDEEVSFEHLMIYKQQLPWATFREVSVGGHQFNNDLTLVANDIEENSKILK